VLAQEREEPHPEEARPAQNEARPEQPRQEQKDAKHEEMKPEKQGDMKPEKQDNQDKKEMEQEQKQGEKGEKQMDRDHKQIAPAGQAGNHEERAGARSGARISDEKFHSNFGRPHTFVVHKTTIVEGQPRFQYGGYWFSLVDVWPGDWAYTDDCYIDYIDGEYFLFDLRHPGMRIALFVVM
jgi:hypothetical protein